MGISRFPSVVDDVTVRLIAGVVLVVGVIALSTQQWWLYAVLAVDFSLRAALGPSASPVARLVQRWIRPAVSAPKRPTAGPPKRFAQGMGLTFTSGAALAWWLGVPALSYALIGLLVVAASLEAFFEICLGCIVFRFFWECEDCNDISERVRVALANRAVVPQGGAQATN
jgi:hypothetical protein